MNSHLLAIVAAPFLGAGSSDILMHLFAGAHLPIILADISGNSIDQQIRGFLDFMQRLLAIPALGLAIVAAFCLWENKMMQFFFCLAGIFVCTVAVPLIKAFFGF